MKRQFALTLVLASLVAAAGFAVEAEVQAAFGLAEANINGEWIPVTTDLLIPEGAVISTGIGAQVILDIQGSTVTVGQFSRVSVAELFAQTSGGSTVVNTALDLPFGRVSAQVRSTQARGNDFRVLSPISTAAVRGTEFDFTGSLLAVNEGDVRLLNLAGQRHSVREGQTSGAFRFDGIRSVEATLADQVF